MTELWVLQLQTLIYTAIGWLLAAALGVFVLVCLVPACPSRKTDQSAL